MTTHQTKSLTIATYYVVPVKPLDATGDGDKFQVCLYYTYDFDRRKWERVKWNEISTKFDSSYVCLIQIDRKPSDLKIDDGFAWKEGVQLLAAVAKTLEKTSSLPNLFLANNLTTSDSATEPAIDQVTGSRIASQVVLPVSRGTKRSVILVFSKLNSENEVVGLIPSSDPEIKNS